MLPRMPPTPQELKKERAEPPSEQPRSSRVRPALPLPPPPPPKPLPPWAVKPVVQAGGETVRFVPAIPVQVAPWSTPMIVLRREEAEGPAARGDSLPRPEQQVAQVAGQQTDARGLPPVPAPEAIMEMRRERKRGRPAQAKKPAKAASYDGPRVNPNTRFIQAANYAAVDPARKLFGLIDRGLSDAKTRALILHIRSRREAGPVFDGIRPGSLLPAVSKSKRGGTTLLRVRYITPSKYYSPGEKISSMALGVDEADWQSLVAKAHRI